MQCLASGGALFLEGSRRRTFCRVRCTAKQYWTTERETELIAFQLIWLSRREEVRCIHIRVPEKLERASVKLVTS